MHAEGVVHCDVKPSNVALFSESVKWKLIDLDEAQKAEESRVRCFTPHYAAPEVLREYPEGDLPVAKPSVDIWSCGILAYEVLTGNYLLKLSPSRSAVLLSVGNRIFEDDLTHDEICEFVLDGRVEEKLEMIPTDHDYRDVISSLLKFDPADRCSAADALHHLAFQSDPQTTIVEVRQLKV